jgi:hypothetical protein
VLELARALFAAYPPEEPSDDTDEASAVTPGFELRQLQTRLLKELALAPTTSAEVVAAAKGIHS